MSIKITDRRIVDKPIEIASAPDTLLREPILEVYPQTLARCHANWTAGETLRLMQNLSK